MPPSRRGESSSFRDFFAHPAGGEAVRAFVIFGALLAVLAAIAGQLAFRELSLQVLTRRLDLGHLEARRIADAITRIGHDSDGIDFSRVRASQELLTTMIHERLSVRPFIHHVEVVDRFGIRQLFVVNEAVAGSRQLRIPDLSVPADWPVPGDQLVVATLAGAEGAVRLGVSPQPLLDELERVSSTLRLKVAVAGLMALGVLVVGLFYVLHLIRKNRLLEQARQSASRASYVGLLASGLAHEIRNPLNAMNMNLQMLEEELQGAEVLQDDECADLLDSTKREIKRLEALVNNFLAYARPAQPRFESRDLNAVVGDVLRFLEADFRRSDVRLESDFEPLLPAVEIDETQLKQALMNLLVNARQVLKGGGTVRVRTRAGSRGDAVIEVSDDGPGIAEDQRERIFEVFYSSRGGGTGLGLPIARQIVERHGGAIELESRIGLGTTFRIHLPRHHAPVVVGAPGGSPA